MMELGELIARIETLSEPSREVDALVWAATLPRDGIGIDGFALPENSWFEHEADDRGAVTAYVVVDGKPIKRAKRPSPEVTASIDAAVALCERVLPGSWWIIAKGKMTAAEPLYGAQMLFGADDVIGEGEGQTPAIALVLATLKALGRKP